MLAYLSQGLSCAQFGVIAQPIQFFMMKGLELSSAQVSSYMAIMMLPWVIKPLYGLISDYVPIFGYRRKSYLVISNAIAAMAFLTMLSSSNLIVILGSLMVTAISMAVATALMCGLAVETGRSDGKVRLYFIIQEIAYYSANILAGLIGGFLCQSMSPEKALHTAAFIAIIPLLLIAFCSAKLLQEKKSSINIDAIRGTTNSLKQALGSRVLWLVALFSFLWSFLPCFGVPLYYYESKTLGFSQASIGQLAGWNAGGMLVASLAYPFVMKLLPLRGQLYFTALIISVSTLTYMGLNTTETATVLEFFRGFANLTAILSIYGLAADVCPKRIEVSIIALLVAIRNLASYAGTYAGGQLFTYVFPGDYSILVLVSAVLPAVTILLVPAVCKWRSSEMVR